MKNIIKIIKDKILSIIYFEKFKNHNKSIFKDFNTNRIKNNKGVILAEFNAFCPEQIGLSYILYNLRLKYNNPKVISHFSHVILSYGLKRTFVEKLKSSVLQKLGLGNFGIYQSMGIKNFYFPEIDEDCILKTKKIFKKFKEEINTREKLEKFKINNILIGDLLYDCYLKKFYDEEPTVKINDNKFINFSYEFILYVVIWIKFFNKNRVLAVIGSHSVYSIGVPLRIAVWKKIKTFAITPEQICNLTKKMPREYLEFLTYKKKFNMISTNQKLKGIEEAKKRYRSKLSGKFSKDYYYVLRSPYKKSNYKNKVLSKSNKIKLVVATHDFVDAPHCLGFSLFPDFYQWLIFLGKISKKTNYDWYIKTHYPYGGKYEIYQPHERLVVRKFVEKFKNFKIIPPKTTMKQIINEGIDGVLTVNGTIGSEIPFFKVPVINASINNPHINYNFNFHPKTREELKTIILNYKKLKEKFKINKKELYQHYFMRNIYYDKNWIFDRHDEMVNEIGYIDQWSYKIFKFWIERFDLKIHNEFLKRINKFIDGKEYRLRRSLY